MRRLCTLVLFLFVATPFVWADTQDTTVFKAAMSPDNEVPVVSAPGNSGLATITVKVTRDGAGNINAATVIFDIDYTVPVVTSFTGLHIHNAAPGTSGGVVINTGIGGGANAVSATGSSHITRVVNYDSTAVDSLKYVTGLLDAPENYYVNIHSTVQPGGLMRTPPLWKTSLSFRPQMSPLQEVPAITDLDAEGAALIQVQAVRNNAGVITSGSVTFDVDYRFPLPVTITGLHIHNGAAGANGPVVIGTAIGSPTREIANATRGNIFRIVDIDSGNTAGLQALTGLFNDPTQFYVNIHTTTAPGGVMRGQLSTNTYAFLGFMSSAEENPPTSTTGSANSMTIVKVTRDGTGNIASGTVTFNVTFTGFAGPVTFTGLHIHNGPIGVNAGVVINTGLNGAANAVIDADGVGFITRDVNAATTDANQGTINAIKGVLANPEAYYVNIHTTIDPGGAVRAQLVREVYHYRAAMSPANENPPVTSSASATGWITVKVSRTGDGVINGGQVRFDVDTNGSEQTTFTGLHIHTGAAADNGAVVINTGISGTSNVTNATGSLNITRVVDIPATDATSIAMLGTLINNPNLAYVNIHTTVNPGGLMRSQMLPVLNYIPQVAGGGNWISSITITNPSTASSVLGIVDTFRSNGSAIPAAFVDPNTSFLIPPGGSTTVNVHNRGDLTTGFGRVYSSGAVTVTPAYNFPAFPSTVSATPVTARSVSIPVMVGPNSLSTGIAVLNVTAGTVILTLRDSVGAPIAGGSRSLTVTAGQHVVGFIRELLPDVTSREFNGALVIENRPDTGNGLLSALALQFDGTLSPVVISPLP